MLIPTGDEQHNLALRKNPQCAEQFIVSQGGRVDSCGSALSDGTKAKPSAGIPLDILVALDPEALIVDLDGTLLAGDEILPQVHGLFAAFGDRIVVATNNSTHSPGEIAKRLALHGLQLPVERVVTAGFALVDRLAEDVLIDRIYPVLPPVLLHYGHQRGLAFVDADDAQVVALARATSLCYRDLAVAAGALAR
ncbi:MAG: hypothetical protein B7X99_19985, partial [Rhizobiales bacterium 17-65-6]